MKTNLTEVSKNVHVRRYDTLTRNLDVNILMLSDLHWDNPKCDRELLKEHLDFALENNYRVHINGDFFCLMQGKYDRRKSKESIRPEHNVNNYFDAIVNTAVEWFKPYAHLIDVIGYGNHETSIIKNQETDVLQRFVDLLNATSETDHTVYTGGYGGWYIIVIDSKPYKIRYFHGSGGGGIVTKGAINLTRAKEMYEGFDCFTMGHIHENAERTDTVSTLTKNYNPINKDLLLLLTGTYKEEYNDGYMGWHVERGAPPKPVGGRLLTLHYHKDQACNRTIKTTSKRLL